MISACRNQTIEAHIFKPAELLHLRTGGRIRGLTSIRNHCTISHIAVLLVALAAHEFGHDDKIRFVRTFVPDFLR